LGLAAGAFCQTYAPFSVDTATVPASTNKKGEIAGTYFGVLIHGFVRSAEGVTITRFDSK
jgi:hypothetical protein